MANEPNVIPGEVLIDDSFKFPDGQTKKKLLIVLAKDYPLLIFLTTSHIEKYPQNQHGCNINRKRYYNYYIPAETDFLRGETIIKIPKVWEFSAGEVLQKVLCGDLHHLGNLNSTSFTELIRCLGCVGSYLSNRHRTRIF